MTTRRHLSPVLLVVSVLVVTLTLAGSGAAGAQQRPSTPVEIVSPLPVPVLDADRGRPFQKWGSSNLSTFVEFGTVPEGERWIIEHASAHQFPAREPMLFTLSVSDGLPATQTFAIDWLVAHPAAGGYTANSQTKVIADAGQQVILFVNGLLETGFRLSASISGRVVPAPAP